MGVSKKPRKKYRPKYEKGTLPMTIRHSAHNDTMLMVVPHEALERAKAGWESDEPLHTMVFRINWAWAMVCEVFEADDENRSIIKAAADALKDAMARYTRIGRCGLTGGELTAIGNALTLCDLMQAKATRREQLAAIKTAELALVL